MNIGFYKAGLKILFRRYFLRDKKFDGNAKQICEAIIEKLWNGEYYQTGIGHFSYFWIRDFGIVADSLIEIGNIDKVQKTVDWALDKYMKSYRVALCIDSSGHVFDAPKESIDALPWLIYSISKSKYILSKQQKLFLEKEIVKFNNKFIDRKTGDILADVSYSELRDAVDYEKSSYSITMLSVLAKYSQKLGLRGFKHTPKTYIDILNEKYWNGIYFKSDINNDAFSAEGNFLPFILGLIKNNEKLKSILAYISSTEMDRPLPMKYTNEHHKFRYHLWGKYVMPNYAGSTIWTWMGAMYLNLLHQDSNPEFNNQFNKFTSMIVKNKNFPELLHPNGEWYKTLLYRGDEGMIWAALYLKTVCPT